MTHATTPLLWVVAAVWGVRQIYQRRLHAEALERRVLFRARRRRVPAWTLYPPYLALLGLAAASIAGTAPTTAQNVGLVTILFGSALAIAAMVHIRHSYTEELEIREGFQSAGGIYRLLRHPMRWGVLLEALGLALVAETAWSYGLVGLVALLIIVRNMDEDTMLREFQRQSLSSAD